MKRTRLFSFLTITVLLFTASIANAATYYVATTGNDANPGTQAQPFRNIQKGIDAAANGDTVQVASGTYNERIVWWNKGLTLKGAGPGQSIIDGGSADASCILIRPTAAATRVEGFTIQNGSGSGGGGIFLNSSNTVVFNCVFRSNNQRANYVQPRNGRGGAMDNLNSSPTVINCTFDGNSAGNGGGAVSNERGNPTFINCTFSNNTAGDGSSSAANRGGGAILNRDRSNPTIINCTFTRNSSDPSGAIVNEDGSGTTVINSIFWGDFGTEIVNNDTSVITITYSNIQGGFAGTGNINANPLFVNAAGGNCRLQSTSPCINMGNASAPNLPTTDLDGVPRILGSAPDMGAYETWLASYGLWFVDTTTGNDTTGSGSPLAPYKTVAKAYAVAANGNKLYIKAGNYGTDRPRITKSLKLFNWGNTGQARIGKP